MNSLSILLQICGLTLLPCALLIGFTAEHGMLGELWLLAIGSAVFMAGRLLRPRPS